MAIAFVAANGASSQTAGASPRNPSCSLDAGTGTGRAILAMVVCDRDLTTGSISACTYNSVSMTAGPQNDHPGNNFNVRTFYLIGDGSVATGSNTLLATVNYDCAAAVVGVSLSGVDSLRGSTVEITNAYSTAISDTIASATDDLIVSMFEGGVFDGTLSADSPASIYHTFDQFFSGNTLWKGAVLYRNGASGTPSIGASHNLGVNRGMAMNTFSLIPAAATATGHIQLLTMGVG